MIMMTIIVVANVDDGVGKTVDSDGDDGKDLCIP